MQLAIQQGTQISQVFGTAGAAGAVQRLKAGFLQMVSPVNLITIGVIAAGAAAIQWLVPSGEEAASLEHQLNSVKDAISGLRDESRKSVADLKKDLGGNYP